MSYPNSFVAYIYELVDPITNDIRYIGKTISPQTRLSSHLANCNRKIIKPTHNYYWIKSLINKGLKPVFRVFACVKEELADEVEISMIELHRMLGYDLTNYADGGSGRSLNELKKRKKVGQKSQGVIKFKKATIHSKFIGVRWNKAAQKWSSTISHNRKSIRLITSYSETTCAYYYDCAALYLFGKQAKTNGLSKEALSTEQIKRESRLESAKLSKKDSNFLGIYKTKDNWIVSITVEGQRYEVTQLQSKIVAARIWDSCMRYYHNIKQRSLKLQNPKHVYVFPITNFEGVGELSIEKARKFSKNLTQSKRSSKYRGVHVTRNPGIWRVTYCENKQRINLGAFTSEKAAAIAYDDYIVKHQINKPLNFPERHSSTNELLM